MLKETDLDNWCCDCAVIKEKGTLCVAVVAAWCILWKLNMPQPQMLHTSRQSGTTGESRLTYVTDFWFLSLILLTSRDVPSFSGLTHCQHYQAANTVLPVQPAQILEANQANVAVVVRPNTA